MQAPTQTDKVAILSTFLDDEAAQTPEEHQTYLQYYENELGVPSGSFNGAFKRTFAAAVAEDEKEHATRALVRVAFMLETTPPLSPTAGSKLQKLTPRSWDEDQSLCAFTESCFPLVDPTQTDQAEIQDALAQRGVLKARYLESICKVRLIPTSNIAEHLVFDHAARELRVFCHVGWLKAHLRRTQHDSLDMGFRASLEKGTLPPQLLLEVLDSLQNILFPDNDQKSAKFLKQFCRVHDFDPETKIRQGHIRDLGDARVEYKYLADRLLALSSFAERQLPSRVGDLWDDARVNPIDDWFARHKSDRMALMVAIVSLLLTTLLGFLTLMFGIVSMVYTMKQHNVAAQDLQLQTVSNATTLA